MQLTRPHVLLGLKTRGVPCCDFLDKHAQVVSIVRRCPPQLGGTRFRTVLLPRGARSAGHSIARGGPRTQAAAVSAAAVSQQLSTALAGAQGLADYVPNETEYTKLLQRLKRSYLPLSDVVQLLQSFQDLLQYQTDASAQQTQHFAHLWHALAQLAATKSVSASKNANKPWEVWSQQDRAVHLLWGMLPHAIKGCTTVTMLTHTLQLCLQQPRGSLLPLSDAAREALIQKQLDLLAQLQSSEDSDWMAVGVTKGGVSEEDEDSKGVDADDSDIGEAVVQLATAMQQCSELGLGVGRMAAAWDDWVQEQDTLDTAAVSKVEQALSQQRQAAARTTPLTSATRLTQRLRSLHNTQHGPVVHSMLPACDQCFSADLPDDAVVRLWVALAESTKAWSRKSLSYNPGQTDTILQSTACIRMLLQHLPQAVQACGDAGQLAQLLHLYKEQWSDYRPNLPAHVDAALQSKLQSLPTDAASADSVDQLAKLVQAVTDLGRLGISQVVMPQDWLVVVSSAQHLTAAETENLQRQIRKSRLVRLDRGETDNEDSVTSDARMSPSIFGRRTSLSPQPAAMGSSGRGSSSVTVAAGSASQSDSDTDADAMPDWQPGQPINLEQYDLLSYLRHPQLTTADLQQLLPHCQQELRLLAKRACSQGPLWLQAHNRVWQATARATTLCADQTLALPDPPADAKQTVHSAVRLLHSELASALQGCNKVRVLADTLHAYADHSALPFTDAHRQAFQEQQEGLLAQAQSGKAPVAADVQLLVAAVHRSNQAGLQVGILADGWGQWVDLRHADASANVDDSPAGPAQQAPQSAVSVQDLVAQLQQFQAGMDLPLLVEVLPQCVACLGCGLTDKQFRQLWLTLADATARCAAKALAAKCYPEALAHSAAAVSVLHTHLDRALESSGDLQELAAVVEGYYEQWSSTTLPLSAQQQSLLQQRLQHPPGKKASKTEGAVVVRMVRQLVRLQKFGTVQPLDMSTRWEGYLRVALRGQSLAVALGLLKTLRQGFSSTVSQQTAKDSSSHSSSSGRGAGGGSGSSVTARYSLLSRQRTEPLGILGPLPRPPEFSSLSDAASYLQRLKRAVSKESRGGELQFGTRRQLEQCVALTLLQCAGLWVGEPVPDVRDVDEWSQLVKQFEYEAVDSDSEDSDESEEDIGDERVQSETDRHGGQRPQGSDDDEASEEGEAGQEETEVTREAAEELGKVVRKAVGLLSQLIAKDHTPQATAQIMWAFSVLQFKHHVNNPGSRRALTDWGKALERTVCMEEEWSFLLPGLEGAVRKTECSFLAAAEEQGVTASLLMAMHVSKYPRMHAVVKLAGSAQSHMASWPTTQARAALLAGLSHLPRAKGADAEQAQAVLVQLIKAFEPVIVAAKGVSGWAPGEESAVSLVSWVLETTPEEHYQVVLDMLFSAAKRLSVDQCLAVLQLTLAHYDNWEEDDDTSHKRQALEKFKMNVVTFLSARTRFEGLGGKTLLEELYPGQWVQLAEVTASCVVLHVSKNRKSWQAQVDESLFSRLCDMIKTQLTSLDGASVLTLTRVLIATQEVHQDSSMVRALVAQAGRVAREVDADELADCVFKLSRAEASMHGEAEVFFNSVLRDAIAKLNDMSLNGLVKLLEALDNLPESRSQDLDSILSQVSVKLTQGDYSQEQIGRVAKAMALARHYHAAMLARLVAMVSDEGVLEGLTISTLSFILYTFAVLDPANPAVPDIFAAAAERLARLVTQGSKVTLKQLSQLAWSYAVADQDPEITIDQSWTQPEEAPHSGEKRSKGATDDAGARRQGRSRTWEAGEKLGFVQMLVDELWSRKDHLFDGDQRVPKDVMGRVHFACRIWDVLKPPGELQWPKGLLARLGRNGQETESSLYQQEVYDILNKMRTLKAVTLEKNVGSFWMVDMVGLHKGADTWLWIEFDGPHHFCSNQPTRPLGPTLIRDKCLQKLAAEKESVLLVVTYHELNDLSTAERQQYLHAKIQSAVGQPAQPAATGSSKQASKGGRAAGEASSSESEDEKSNEWVSGSIQRSKSADREAVRVRKGSGGGKGSEVKVAEKRSVHKPTTVGKAAVKAKSKVVSNESKVVSNESKVVSNESKVVSNESKVVSNESKVVSNESKVPKQVVKVPKDAAAVPQRQTSVPTVARPVAPASPPAAARPSAPATAPATAPASSDSALLSKPIRRLRR